MGIQERTHKAAEEQLKDEQVKALEKEKELKLAKKKQKKRESSKWMMSDKKRRAMEEQDQISAALRLQLEIPSIPFSIATKDGGSESGRSSQSSRSSWSGSEEGGEAGGGGVLGVKNSKYAVVVDTEETAAVQHMPDTSDDRVYSCWVEGKLVPDMVTRDEYYCHVCRALGKGGRNMNEIVAQDNLEAANAAAAVAAVAEEKEMNEEEQMQEAMRLVREAENEAVRKKLEGGGETVPEVDEEGGGGGGSGGGAMEKERERPNSPEPPHQPEGVTKVVKVDFADAANTSVELM